MKPEMKSKILQVSSKGVAFTCILTIFIILLLQSALSLFFSDVSEGLGQIDIVFRTSLTSIFGYLISVVSIKSVMNKKGRGTDTQEVNKQNAVGFKVDSTDITNEGVESRITNGVDLEEKQKIQFKVGKTEETRLRKIPLNYQIIILASVCIFCLLVMVVVRNFSHYIVPSDSSVATLSMYRDFISTTIGALIGISKD